MRRGCMNRIGGVESKNNETWPQTWPRPVGLKNKPNRSDSSEPDRFGTGYKYWGRPVFSFPLPLSLSSSLFSQKLSFLSLQERRTPTQKLMGFTMVGRVSGGDWPAGTTTPPRRNPNLYFFCFFLFRFPPISYFFFCFFSDFFLKLFHSLFSLMDSKFASKMGTKSLYLYKEKESIPLGVLDRFRSGFEFVMLGTAQFCES